MNVDVEAAVSAAALPPFASYKEALAGFTARSVLESSSAWRMCAAFSLR